MRHALFGLLPPSFQERIRTAKRKVSPHTMSKGLITWTIGNGIQQVEMFKKAGIDPKGKTYLELGTGWYPIVPVIFHLYGCGHIKLVDSQKLMDLTNFRKTCDYILEDKKLVSEKLGLPEGEIEQRLLDLKALPLKDALAKMDTEYLAPNDILENSIPDNSIDIISSRAVLEHVPPEIILKMFSEFHRMLKPDGGMCHIIDNADHWQYVDDSISKLNFLRYGPRVYGWIANSDPLQYMNRLRHPQYLEMMANSGFEIALDESTPDSKALDDLTKLKLHPDFSNFSPEEIATLTSYVVARPMK